MKNTEKLDKTLEKTASCGYNNSVLFCDGQPDGISSGLPCVLGIELERI